jgi:hypothetical protein
MALEGCKFGGLYGTIYEPFYAGFEEIEYFNLRNRNKYIIQHTHNTLYIDLIL